MKKLFNWFLSLFKEEKQPEAVTAPEPIVEVVKAKAKPATKKAPAKKAETAKKKPIGKAEPKKPAAKKTKGK